MTAAKNAGQQQAQATEEPIRGVLPSQVNRLGQHILELEAIVPATTKDSDILHPDMWVNCYGKMQPYCKIHVLWADGSRYAEIMCTHLNARGSRFVFLRGHELEKVVRGVNFGPDYDVEQRGVQKWCIIDKKTGDVVKDMIETQQVALREVDDLKKARAR